jgi:hypothetical protein
MHKLARISFNSSDWKRPTGEARKYEVPGTYNHEQGFGHEDRLFRSEWQIDGWRYAFIEGVNRSHRTLVNSRCRFSLFTLPGAACRATSCSVEGMMKVEPEKCAHQAKNVLRRLASTRESGIVTSRQ